MHGIDVALVHDEDIEEVLQGKEVDIAVFAFQVHVQPSFRAGGCAVQGAVVSFEAVAEDGYFIEGGAAGAENAGDEFHAVGVPCNGLAGLKGRL